MLYLLLAIVAASTYSILFKLFACRDIDSLQAIAFNYLTAALLGIAFSFGTLYTEGVVLTGKEWWLSVAMGAMFMTAFVLMARSTAKVGVSVTTVAARVALVIPVVCSYLLLPDQQEPRWGAIVVILLALVMVIWQQKPQTNTTVRPKHKLVSLLLPLGVFLLFGTNNFCLKWVQNGMSAEGGAEQLSAAIFLFAALFSGTYYFAASPQRKFSWRAMLGGVALGVANFFTTYCMILALGVMSGSVFFPIYHVGIVALVATLGVFIFGERLSKVQIAGLVVAACGIVAFFV